MIRQFRDRDLAAYVALVQELTSLSERVQAADIYVAGALPPGLLAGAIRVGFDAGARLDMAFRSMRDPELDGCDVGSAWRVAAEDEWLRYRTDESWHAVFWMREWPRVSVRRDFVGSGTHLVMPTPLGRSAAAWRPLVEFNAARMETTVLVHPGDHHRNCARARAGWARLLLAPAGMGDAVRPSRTAPLGVLPAGSPGRLAASVPCQALEPLLRTVLLVEGVSDQRALEALARRRGRNLDAERISIVPMGGATNIGHFLRRLGAPGADLRLAGLCDAGEEGDFRRSLEQAGLGSPLTRSDMERLGFYVCVADLEDELIRALGVPAVERVIDAVGELESFRRFQKQPAWRGRADAEQLRRFLGTHSGRKIQTAALLVDALDLARVPPPLDGVLAHV